jgi:signal-transduction protein with cAMP-binding, CBS, and nucleotidyltransferase domain
MTQDSSIEPHVQAGEDKLRATLVRDVMHPGIVSCSQAATAAEIARIMASRRVHCVAVMGLSQDQRHDPLIWGIVSDLNLLEAATDPGSSATAATLAGEPVISIRSTMSVHDAAKAMVQYGAAHVVVVDPERRTPLGILSTLDVAEVLAGGAP